MITVFPFDMLPYIKDMNTAFLKLMRIGRLPKFMKILDVSKFD